MKKSSLTALNLRYAKILQDYEILFTAIITYWVALVVGLIIAFITKKLIFNVFFVSVLGISTLITIVSIFYLDNLRSKLQQIIQEVK